MGHSVGELSAAYVAGVLTLADAAMLVAARGRLMQGLLAGGAMVSVAASERDVVPLLREGVAIAAINGPESVVISGAQSPVRAIAQGFARQGRRVRPLAVSHAFHSPLMEPMLEEFARVAARVKVRQPQIAIVSNVTAELARSALVLGRPSIGWNISAGLCGSPTVRAICKPAVRLTLLRPVPVVVWRPSSSSRCRQLRPWWSRCWQKTARKLSH